LIPLSDLISPTYFPYLNKTELALKQSAATTALNSYCAWLQSQGVVGQCAAPGPDPPTPAGSIFAGAYQNDDCGKDNVVNPFTNAMNCPAGSNPNQIGRVFAPESRCGASQFVCIRGGLSHDPELNYAGGYQFCDDNNHNDYYVNPFTGKTSCPAGYTPCTTGRVLGAEAKVGCNQISCINTSHVPTYETTAGFYQLTDTGSGDHITNVFTQATSCPVKYCAVQHGRVHPPEGGGAGGNQFVCIACNLLNLFP